MALATLHSKKKKTALILVRANEYEMSKRPAYIPLAPVADMEEGEEFEIKDGFTFIPMLDKDGNPYTTKDGKNVLHSLKW
jgi:hypothetical protein